MWLCIVVFKQKTAYDLRISDWSSDVCSSDLVGGKSYEIYRLDALAQAGLDVASLPYSLKILLENLLRTENGTDITADDIQALANWDANAEPSREIAFTPARVVLQDFTGVPAVVDLAAMREAMQALGGNANRLNPLADRKGHV